LVVPRKFPGAIAFPVVNHGHCANTNVLPNRNKKVKILVFIGLNFID